MDSSIELIKKLYNENNLHKEEISYLLENLNEESKKLLFESSEKTCRKHYNGRVFMRGLIEFSNVCGRHCKYCGLRSPNTGVERYRLSKEEILACCKEGYELGYRTFVLQSGEDPFYAVDVMLDIIYSIKNSFPDTALTLSIGERSIEEYRKFYEAGADRYLLRHETISKKLYKELHPYMELDERVKCLYDLKEIGYQVGAGFMVGLPGQTFSDIADDLLFLKELSPQMIGIGPFIPHSSTPLRDEKGGTVDDTLPVIAVARLLLPDSLIPATTAMGTLKENGRELALKAGANVVMPNLTPTSARPKYQLYENKICLQDAAAGCRVCIEKRINSAGFTIDMGRGDHPAFMNSYS